MEIYRISDARYPLWDGFGAALWGGRWNSPGRPVIYGSLSYATAMLEILVHANIGRVPHHHRLVIAQVPASIPVEKYEASALPEGWNQDESRAAQLFGDQWVASARSAVLILPSAVAPREWNALVNPVHQDVNRIVVSGPEVVEWDRRLFRS